MNDVYRALADPTRREILRKLHEGPMTSGNIAQEFDSTWATISRHLSVLTAAELVTSTRNGQNVVYELNTTVFQEFVASLLEWTKSKDGDHNA
jgi:DNA-binding transcriptional ArsR family regulator